MEDLTFGQLLEIHDRNMTTAGGDCRVLSEANLHQLVFRANLISACVPRAAFVFYSLCAYPAFREGNYPSALALTEQVLASGGYQLGNEKAGLLALAEAILAFTAEPEDVEQWLSDNIEDIVPG